MLATQKARRLLSGFLVAALCVSAVAWSRRSRAEAMTDSGLQSRAKGPAGAKVLLTEFSDFQCPSCRYARPIVEELLKQYDGKVRFVFRHYPLNQHSRARDAALAAECAARQGKFWAMHDLLFDKQDEWTNAPDLGAQFAGYAQTAGLDAGSFAACISRPDTMSAVDRDVREGDAWQVTSTPTLFVGHRRLAGARQIQLYGPGLIETLLK